MRTKWYHTVPVVTVAALVAQPAAGQTTYTGGPEGSWHTVGNWNNGVPHANIRAIIPSGKSCKIYNGNPAAEADSFEVDGTLTLQGSQTLTINTDSDIDGRLVLEGDDTPSGARLLITAGLTITGYGGEIQMNSLYAVIDEASGSHELTLESNCTGTLAVDCGLSIIGAGEINCGLVNNGFVIADWCPPDGGACALQVNGVPTSGDGEWQAQKYGKLQVNVEVTGPGTWRIRVGSNPANEISKIEVNECCHDLTGDVILQNGKFEINADFCTTGDLTLESVLKGYQSYTSPKIDVAADALATFSLTTCQSCP